MKSTLLELDKHPTACAILFANGNALYYTPDGYQLTDIQGKGLSGLHEFYIKYPKAKVFWGIWEQSLIVTEVHDVINLLNYLRKPEEVTDYV